MTANDRIKYLRKVLLDKTQQEFSSMIMISRSNLGNIETGTVEATDRVITSICEKFNVNENWIKSGIEPVFKDSARISLDDYAKSKGATDLDLKIIKLYLELDPDIRKNLVEHFRNGLKEVPNRVEQFNTDECLTASNDEGTSEVPSIAASSDETISEEQFWEEVEPAEEKTTG